MTTDKTKEFMMPKDSNCESLGCQYCGNETLVLQKDNIKSYTCPACYSVQINK